jgi:hypothetical protein
VIDQKRQHARVAVFGRIGDEREAADHLVVHHIVDGAAYRGRPLSGQDFVVVAVIQRTAFPSVIALARRRGEQFAERAFFLALGGRPI